MFNPNITGMPWLLNSTGICVLFVTQFYVAFLLHKVGMPVQLVVFCRCTRGGVGGLLCTLRTPWPQYTMTVTSEGTTFLKEETMKALELRKGK